MDLSTILVSEFAKITNDEKTINEGATLYGTYRIQDNAHYVQIDGSDTRTPVSTTVTAKDGDRVTVLLKDHKAVVTGNLEDPSASSEALNSLSGDYTTLVSTVQGITDDMENLSESVAASIAAFEDSINEAKKYTTNYINYVAGTGLIIGNQTGSSLTKNIVLESTGMDIRDGSTILARYASNGIWLARNNRDATIDICDGLGLIKATTNHGLGFYGMSIKSDLGLVAVGGKGSLLLNDMWSRWGFEDFYTYNTYILLKNLGEITIAVDDTTSDDPYSGSKISLQTDSLELAAQTIYMYGRPVISGRLKVNTLAAGNENEGYNSSRILVAGNEGNVYASTITVKQLKDGLVNVVAVFG